MFKKTMKHLTNNPSLKILSIVIAVFLWIIVVNLDDPSITNTYVVQVSVENESMMEETGKAYSVVGQSNFVTIYVNGKRSVMDKMTSSDFTATADFSQIIDNLEETGEKRVPIDVVAERHADEITITKKTNNMRIYVENSSTEQFYISSTTTGTPMEGYAIGKVSSSPNLIKISGPESVVSKISKVVATVNVAGLSQDVTDSVTPVIYDFNGNVIESGRLILSQEQVTVSVQMLLTKSVPVKCETTGTPAEGYLFIGLEYEPEKITIKGERATLNNITAITIPGEAINLDGAIGNVENIIDINTYLEELGVSLVSPEKNKITVRALVEQLGEKGFELSVSSIEVLNLAEKCEVSYHDSIILIPIRGRDEDVSEITADQIKASVNLINLKPGTHTVPLNLVVDEKLEVLRTVTLQITIQEITDEPEGGGGTGTESEMSGETSH